MMAVKIHVWVGKEYKHLPIAKAIPLLTDGFIDNGNCCPQTTIDLRDALIESQAHLAKAKKKIRELEAVNGSAR